MDQTIQIYRLSLMLSNAWNQYLSNMSICRDEQVAIINESLWKKAWACWHCLLSFKSQNQPSHLISSREIRTAVSSSQEFWIWISRVNSSNQLFTPLSFDHFIQYFWWYPIFPDPIYYCLCSLSWIMLNHMCTVHFTSMTISLKRPFCSKFSRVRWESIFQI